LAIHGLSQTFAWLGQTLISGSDLALVRCCERCEVLTGKALSSAGEKEINPYKPPMFIDLAESLKVKPKTAIFRMPNKFYQVSSLCLVPSFF
jgi:hypothetical protein